MREVKEPKRKEKRKAKNLVNFWVTDEELKRIDELAKPFKNRSYFLRNLLKNHKLKIPLPSINLDAFLTLGKSATNLNQITRRVNSAEANIFQRSTKDELLKVIEELRGVLVEVQREMLVRKYK
ncbi:plasmid mobilization relaxosome protein MobC [Labilibacter marinus]|uniref:plasmid mobilization relaxosome protein MobC n=1 Tax=Labilibacter marinus TaxID=1477105 RepID=UPI00094F91E7|nr:plasmid mobilization relaxosome protein MobC [Labilibacter marinus]